MAAATFVMLTITGLLLFRTVAMPWIPDERATDSSPTTQPPQLVREGESIAAALSRSQQGTDIVVEPGEYL